MAGGNSLNEALERLDEVTRRLRAECPWDREQDAVSIVPHTVEEAYELAEAARQGDDEAMRDELGDVLFQVVFLSLLLEERGEGDLASVATQLTEKLIRRHPHVFGDQQADFARLKLENIVEISADFEGGRADCGDGKVIALGKRRGHQALLSLAGGGNFRLH